MQNNLPYSPQRVLFPVGLGTALSLIGDTSLYAVLPTHIEDAGVTLAVVGILLSANRFIRLVLNGPIGLLYDKMPRRHLFVPALFLGALSTAIYALTFGFWPLLAGRLLWGIAWVGIWIGGNTIILDISDASNRGRRVGIYQIFFFLGASGGAMLGGLLTDWLGYHLAMGVAATLTLTGAISALLFLPETRGLQHSTTTSEEDVVQESDEPTLTSWGQLTSAFGLLGVNRLVVAGFLLSTFGLFLLEQTGESTELAGFTVGVATLTGVGLGIHGIIAMISAPFFGSLSDRVENRWRTAAGGLVPGIAGFGLLAIGSPILFLLGMPLTAISGGSNQGLSTALVGDLSGEQNRGRRLGVLFTVGDLASAVGPLLAYAVIPLLGLSSVYLLSAGLFGLMFFIALWWGARRGE